MRHTISAKSRIIGLMILCWLIPLILLTALNGYYIYSSHFENKVSKQVEQMVFNDKISLERLNRTADASRDASYDGKLVGLYQEHQDKKLSDASLLSSSRHYIEDEYGREQAIQMAVLWYKENPKVLNCGAYNSSEGGSYGQIREYWFEKHDKIAKLAEKIGTKAALYHDGTDLYMVRNLLDASYHEVATLVFLLNSSYCFENYDSFPENTSVTIQVDECRFQLSGTQVEDEKIDLSEKNNVYGYRWEKGILYAYHAARDGDYQMITQARFTDSTYFIFYGYRLLLVVMAFLLIPLLAVLIHGFNRHVGKPIQKLVDGAREIEKGELGYQVTYCPGNREFRYLTDTFNKMSGKLKYQFEHIYRSELALRDARLKALQAHLNPHFMNNTLEIINWEARMAGNLRVTEMIEALSTLMDASLDRKGKPEVLLSEEMIYVNAYLYIISQRFGKRLTVKQELPEAIMEEQVPRLILQPLIENAVEHGVAKKSEGMIFIRGYREKEYLYLEIINDSPLTAEEKETIQRLLNDEYDSSAEPEGNIGITNVNQRLKILHGKNSGLSIAENEDGQVVARLTINTTR